MEFIYLENDDIPFNNQEIETAQQTIIKNINSYLNQTRYDGLLMLDKVLPTCSKDTLSKYGLFWITNATKKVENVHSGTQDLTLACKVLGFLIEHCKNIPELHKQISTRNVKQIISALNALQTDKICGAVYYLIAVLLYHYPEVCERFQGLIKKIILLQIDSKDNNLVHASAKCFVLFSKDKPACTKLIHHQMLLCNSLHNMMNQFFPEFIVDIQDQLDLPYIDKVNYVKQSNRFSNLCSFLSLMLSGYEAKNSVLPQIVLAVVTRGLVITPGNLKNELYIIWPKLYISLLSVLNALINGFAQELLPFGKTILELFEKILKWTSTDLENKVTFSNSKPFRIVKIQAYKCLSSWLMNTSSLSGIETIANECVSFILKDITPERDRILLIGHQKTSHLSKRAIKRFKQSQYENSTVLNDGKDSNKSRCLDPDLCKEALITLQNILSSGTILLKETFYKNVLNTVIPLLRNFYLGSEGFYKNNQCRFELFKLLKALQMNPNIKLAFPIQYYLEISQMAANNDIDINIVQEAKLALAELEKIIHPVAPTLQLPRQQEPDNNEFTFENQEEVITSKSDKRSFTEEEFPQNVDVTLSARKRIKIIEQKCVEITQNGNNIQLIEVNNSTLNADKSQMEANSCEDIINKVNKNNRTEEELPEDTDVVSCKQPKIIASKCADIISNENTTKLIEMNNSMMVIDNSQEENLCKKGETGNILEIQEQDVKHCNKEKNQYNIDEIVNSTTESKVECELIANINIEEKQLKENLISCTNKIDKRLEEIPLENLSATTKEVYMEMNDPENQEEELSINSRDSPDPFQEYADWQD